MASTASSSSSSAEAAVLSSSSSTSTSSSSVMGNNSTQQLPPAVLNGIKNFIASGLAAACAKTLLAPFDTIKTMQQQVVRDIGSGETGLGLAEAAKVIMRRPRGFLELYAGLGVSALGAMPSVGLYFGVYSYSKDLLAPIYQKALSNNNNEKPILIRTLTVATSAAIGNTVASFSRVPHEVVKQKLQTGQYPSALVGIKDLFQNQGGMKAFFPTGGIRIQMIRDIPYAIFTLLAYESLRDHWVNAAAAGSSSTSGNAVQQVSTTTRPVSNTTQSRTALLKQQQQQRRENSRTTTTPTVKPWKDMVAGGLSGGIGSYLTNPMDVIKTRLQTDSAMYDGKVWRCVRATYAEGGARAFLRGSVPRLIHKIPANASFFVFYEFFRRALKVDDAVIASGGGGVEEDEKDSS